MPQGRAGATGGPLKAFRSTPLQTDACKWLPGCRRTFPRALVKRVASLRDSLARLDDAKKVSGDRAGAVAQHFGDWVVVAFTEPTCEAPEGILRSELNIFDADMPDAPCAWTEVLDTMDLESDAPPPPPDDCRQVVDTMGTTRGDFPRVFFAFASRWGHLETSSSTASLAPDLDDLRLGRHATLQFSAHASPLGAVHVATVEGCRRSNKGPVGARPPAWTYGHCDERGRRVGGAECETVHAERPSSVGAHPRHFSARVACGEAPIGGEPMEGEYVSRTRGGVGARRRCERSRDR